MPSAAAKDARHPRVIALANQKGGVGKTTTTINLGACLAELGFRTLIVDLDPQANASSGLDVDVRGLDVTIYHVLLGEASLIDCIEATAVKNLFVAPSSLDLAGAELELAASIGRENRLKRALAVVVDDYDMGVTHVVRGDDHLNNAARQLQITSAPSSSRSRLSARLARARAEVENHLPIPARLGRNGVPRFAWIKKHSNIVDPAV